ncbi:hypothetical protein SAMN02745174_00721 [Cetobacterium ceti]|uniref:Uncharacterized protein n=1 Tax=Cetobacterium ceti TaxID=180163 RepID=A0A1T4L220_9FUSO|nr:hypothetical protein [Cetobacterium ceti]SJZ48638.1 hypothetical protein SAMN02745174_00721 [Cetobacterium ceti]
MAIGKERFRKALNDYYSKEVLFKLFKRYFLDWIADGYIGSNLGLFEISLISETTNKPTFLELMEQMFSKEEIFKNIYSSLPKEVKEVFEEIAWQGRFLIKDRGIYLKGEKNYDLNSDLKDEFLFFKIDGDMKKGEFLYLHNDIIRVMRKFLPKPKDYYIYATSENAKYRNSNEESIVENLKIYYDFYKQGGMQLSSSGKLLKESKNNMKKYCEIDEFYEESKDLDYLKTETIALFFFLLKEEYLTDEFMRASNIKDIVNKFLDGDLIKNDKSQYITLFLNYLKGIKNITKSKDEIKRGLQTIKDVLKEFPEEKPVSIKNIVNRILFRDDFIEIIDVEEAYSSIYINEANYERTRIMNYNKYLAYVAVPFIKSVFFILATLGVVEIYYDQPSINNSLYLKNGYLSKYDGLKFVRLTDLGKYILGMKEDYEFKFSKEEGEVYLEEDRLIATILGDAPIKTMYLEKIGHRIAPNKFKVARDSFLKGVENSEDILERIGEFKEKIADRYSQVWLEFFHDLEKKSNSVKVIPEYKVLKLQNEKELITAITKDSRFKELILKGEDYHILVKSENSEKVKELFKEYGYYVNI